MFQSTRSINRNFCANISFQAHLGLTYAFIHGLDLREIQSFKECVRQLARLVVMPTFVPLVLLEFREGMCRKSLTDCQSAIEKIESETGLRPQWWSSRQRYIPKPSRSVLNEIDFEQVTQNITSASTKVAYINYRCEIYLPILDLMSRINKEIVDNVHLDQKSDYELAELGIGNLIGRVKALLECTLARAGYQTARADIQRQTVSKIDIECIEIDLTFMPRFTAWWHKKRVP